MPGSAGGITFDRWNTAADGGGTNYDPDDTFTMGAADVTLYAQYLPKTIPFSDDFELRTLGPLDGQNGWSASYAVVQTNEALDAQAVSIDSDIGFVARTFGDNQTNVWTDFYLQPIFCPEDIPDSASDETVKLYFDIDGNPVVYDGTNRTVISGSSISSGQWVRVTIHSDYVAKTWDLYIDNDSVATGLGFYNAAVAGYNYFAIEGGSATAGATFDNVSIGLTSPLDPLSSDYAAWLLKHYGTTDVDDNQLAASGVTTIREAYVAGLDPKDASALFKIYNFTVPADGWVVQWTSVSGRVYNVYWSSNLLQSGAFELIGSNIPWTTSSFTDTVHQAEEKGFYRINVQLE